jgi:hypothetical protein
MVFVGNSYGQKVPYEKLEGLSKEISQLQLEANGKSYNDGINDIEISFPEENFTVSISSHLGTKAIYKKSNDKELLYLTENIDLSKAIGMVSFSISKDMLGLKLYFPQGYLKTQIIENGTKSKTINEEYLEFFRIKKDLNGASIFNHIDDLCSSIKKEKKLITQEIINEENSDWKKLTPEAYIKKNPNSLKTMQAKHIIVNRENLKLERGKLANSIINYAAEISNAQLWKPNMTANEFKSYNPSISKESWTTTYLDGNSHYSRKMGVHLTVGGYLSEGPQSYTVNKSGEVSAFGTTIKKEKNSSKEIRKLYEDAKQISKEKVGSSNFSEKKGSPESFTISVPKSAEDPNSFQYYITTFIFEVDKWSFIQIHFHITNTP